MIKNETLIFKTYLALKDRRESDKDKQKLNLHWEKFIKLIFFDTRLFFDAISVNPFFLKDGVKNNDVVIFFLHCQNKTVQTFDIVSKIHRPVLQ